MRVLLTGAHGFIGGFIARALRDAGHVVVACVRTPRAADEIACDFGRDVDAATWLPRLAGIDAVVNAAGILRETGAQTFEAVHVAAPLALFRAAAQARLRKVVQVSALGEPGDGAFIATKHRADAALAQLDVDWTVLRPGLVCSAHGCYGGTALLRALAVLPGVVFLPGAGAQRLRPVLAEDVARAVVAALAAPAARQATLEVVGPDILTFAAYLTAWRRWFGLRDAQPLRMPRWIVELTVSVGQALTRGPVCRVIWHLLVRERIGAADAPARLADVLGITPQPLADALRERPARDAELAASRLYLWLPALRGAFAFLWIASGLVGLCTPAAQVLATVPAWPAGVAVALARATGVADLALGLLLVAGVQRRRVLLAMFAMLAAYTIGIGVLAPAHWLDPFGGLLKNLVLLVALALLIVLGDAA